MRGSTATEGCIDDERQFKTVKRSQAPVDATVLNVFFRDNFVIFRRRSKKNSIFGISKFFYACLHAIFNFRDGHVTTFRHRSGAYISHMPCYRLFRLAKGTPSESQLSIGTIDLV